MVGTARANAGWGVARCSVSLLCGAVLCGALWAGSLRAQEPAGDAGPPRHVGKGKVTQAVGQKGALFDIGQGATLYIPPRLPIGDSRVLTFQVVSTKPAPNQIQAGFVSKGPALAFDGALDARGKPIVVSVRTSGVQVKPGQRLVLAMELLGLCDERNQASKRANGLCSIWELIDAGYANGELTAGMESTGGLRLQFGTVPTE